MALSARSVDHAYVQVDDAGDVTYDDFEAAFLSKVAEEIPGDEQ